MEAIGHAGTCLGIVSSDGILLAAERKVTGKLLDHQLQAGSDTSTISKFAHEKLFKISDDIWVAVAGLTSDANLLIDYSRQRAAQYMMTYGEPIPLEQLVESLSNLKQSYTQHGGTHKPIFYLYIKVCDRLVRASCMPDGTRSMGSSCTRVILLGITVAGRLAVLEEMQLLPSPPSKTTMTPIMRASCPL